MENIVYLTNVECAQEDNKLVGATTSGYWVSGDCQLYGPFATGDEAQVDMNKYAGFSKPVYDEEEIICVNCDTWFYGVKGTTLCEHCGG